MRLLLATFAFIAVAQAAFAQSSPQGWGPIVRTTNVGDVEVKLSAVVEFKKADEPGRIEARVLVDLSDLQAKVPEIIARFPLPRDNCAKFTLVNPVASISRAQLLHGGDGVAVLSLDGNVEAWTCLENPVPNSKVEMQIKDVGLGIKTKVPVVITWPGDPIENKTGSQSFSASLPMSLGITEDNHLRLIPSAPSIDLSGQYVDITNGILKIADVDINALAFAALNEAIDPNALLFAIPDELDPFNPVLTAASFGENNGHLAADVRVTVEIGFAELLTLIAKLAINN